MKDLVETYRTNQICATNTRKQTNKDFGGGLEGPGIFEGGLGFARDKGYRDGDKVREENGLG